MKNTLLFLMLCIMTFAWASSVKVGQSNSESCQPKDFAALKAFFHYNPQQNTPLIMAHRGGPAEGFPENCLATFRHTLQQVPCPLIEFDVRMSKDSVLLLAHDDELERMSNGTGFVSKSLWKDMKPLYLKNEEDQVSAHHPPLFKQALDLLRKNLAF